MISVAWGVESQSYVPVVGFLHLPIKHLATVRNRILDKIDHRSDPMFLSNQHSFKSASYLQQLSHQTNSLPPLQNCSLHLPPLEATESPYPPTTMRKYSACKETMKPTLATMGQGKRRHLLRKHPPQQALEQKGGRRGEGNTPTMVRGEKMCQWKTQKHS